jgi:hypothetical protein
MPMSLEISFCALLKLQSGTYAGKYHPSMTQVKSLQVRWAIKQFSK